MSGPMEMPRPNVVSKPAADISFSNGGTGIIQYESYPIIPKNNGKEEYLRPVKMSDIIKIKNEAQHILKRKIKWDEFALSASNLFFGVFLSALISNVALASIKGIIFYIIAPIISSSLAVFVVMHKVLRSKIDSLSANTIIKTIEIYEDTSESKESKK